MYYVQATRFGFAVVNSVTGLAQSHWTKTQLTLAQRTARDLNSRHIVLRPKAKVLP